MNGGMAWFSCLVVWIAAAASCKQQTIKQHLIKPTRLHSAHRSCVFLNNISTQGCGRFRTSRVPFVCIQRGRGLGPHHPMPTAGGPASTAPPAAPAARWSRLGLAGSAWQVVEKLFLSQCFPKEISKYMAQKRTVVITIIVK